MPPSIAGRSAFVTAASLILGPLVTSIGDLFHPAESHDMAELASIILANASPWFYSHLLIFFGMLIYVPGLLALPELVAKQNPTSGVICRILLVIGAAAFSGVFVGEMLIGRFAMDGAGLEALTALVATVEATLVSGPAIVGTLAFLGGYGLIAARFKRVGSIEKWAGIGLMLGLALILVEIASAEVLFSKLGNLVLLAASTAFAIHILRAKGKPSRPNAGKSPGSPQIGALMR